VAVEARDARWSTIADDLEQLAGDQDLSGALVLFHAPPHDTPLDLADLAGQSIDHVPLDPHVGSMAVRRFIESRQPAVTLHGHVHESSRLSGAWRTSLGRTECFNAAYEGSELALVRFDLEDPRVATRELIEESDS
jgi:Icc-related predicted phosphoesterase